MNGYKEPREYEKNVHFWLRKIYYFVHFAKVEDAEVTSAQASSKKVIKANIEDKDTEDERVKNQGQPKEKGDAERVMRGNLGLNEDIITKEEAEEACEKLYEMFNMPLDEDVLTYMEDRRCAGGRPRSM